MISIWYKKLMVIQIIVGLTSTAWGAFYVRPEGAYNTTNDLDNGLKTNKTQTSIEASLGYMMSEGYALGVTYNLGNTNTTYKSSTVDSKQIEDVTAVGIEYGLQNALNGGLILLGTYFPSASIDFKDGTDKFKGTGFQIKVGYGIKLTTTHLTLNLNYRSLTFDKYNGDKVTNPYKRQGFSPSIGLIIFL